MATLGAAVRSMGRAWCLDGKPGIGLTGVGGGNIDDATRLGTLRANDLLPSSPVAGKGLVLQRLFQVAPGPCDFHGTPVQPGMKFDLGASQNLVRRQE